MEKIIVSFTSYPKRIHTIHKVLDSIIEQSITPDKIVLYLSSVEFDGFQDMPDLEKYKEYGFEIHWHKENLKSHKKWFYAFQEYPNDIVITFDDDILYKRTAIESLLRYHEKFPNAVIARNISLITCNEDGTIAPYEQWYVLRSDYVGMSRGDFIAKTGWGTLYSPRLFSNEVFAIDVFMEKCPYADDIWMKIMEAYSGISVVLAEGLYDDPILMEHQKNCLFQDYNHNGGNDKQLKALMEYYPYVNGGDKPLIDCIFESGRIHYADIKKMERRKMEDTIEKFILKLMAFRKILIYGAGKAGNRICRLLQQNELDIIESFVVNDTTNNPCSVGGILVKDYREFLNTDEIILIALYDKSQSESVRKQLEKSGVESERIILLDSDIIHALMYIPDKTFNSQDFWETRYLEGGTSGSGSYNQLAEFKAEILNDFVEKNHINKVIEWGCGDGNQLKLARYPSYVGFDVSLTAIELCKKIFENENTKKFIWCGDDNFENEDIGDLAISLDVIFHLIEDDVYNEYMRRLFTSSNKYVCIYSSDVEEQTAIHVKHRKFTAWIENNLNGQWELIRVVKNRYPYSEELPDTTSYSDFYFYEKVTM